LVSNGHEVTLFASGFPGGSEVDEHDGIRIIRKGTWYNANYVLPFCVRDFAGKHPVDLIIDDVNKIPFFLPAVTKVRVVPVVPHLFGTTVYRETNALFATYVYLWERLIPLVYKGCRFAVISPSTRDDLVGRGIPAERIDVVLCGLDHATYRRIEGIERYPEPTIVHFGRMRKYKAIDVVVRAFSMIRSELSNARLLIVGDGPEKPSIVRLVEKLDLVGCVRFLGVVTTGELVGILNQAHLFLNASPKEGWGLTVVEANACGVPVVASNRPGLRDSVRNGETGYLVEYGDHAAFAAKSLELLRDRPRWNRMSAAAVQWAQSMTWDRTAQEMERIFLREIARPRRA
jgi:glycosyltransferase involved in cell wall biosynthesis